MIEGMKYVALVIMFIGIMAIVLGGVFIGISFEKKGLLQDEMTAERVTYLLPEEEIAKGNVIDTANEADEVADTIREHRRSIAPTYGDLLGDGRYDPTNPEHLSYNQAMNMENYLYLAVLGFGVVDLALGTGIALILIGAGVAGTGIALFAMYRRILPKIAANIS